MQTTSGQNESVQHDYGAYDQRLRQSMKELAGHTATLSAFTSLHVAAVNEGELSAKVKELMAVAIAIVLQCEGCIIYHLRNALEAGASEKEVYEAADVAILMGGGPAVVYAAQLKTMLAQMQE
ncbi:MAG: carboxymuconolactone decarboxylase family protein [Caldilineaceae bacterium]